MVSRSFSISAKVVFKSAKVSRMSRSASRNSFWFLWEWSKRGSKSWRIVSILRFVRGFMVIKVVLNRKPGFILERRGNRKAPGMLGVFAGAS